MDGLTRRRLLAVGRMAALGGCPDFGASGEAEMTPLDATAVATAVSGPLPDVTEPFPVLVAASHFANSRRAVRSTLAELPGPLPTDGRPTRRRVRLPSAASSAPARASRPADNAETARE